jgi:hypothetical protein
MNLNIERKENLSSITIPGVDDLTIEVGVTEFNYAFLRVNSRHRALYGNGTWEVKAQPEMPGQEGWMVTEVKVEQPSWAFGFVHTMRDVTLSLTNNPDLLDPVAVALLLIAIGKELEHHAMSTSKEKQEARYSLEYRLRMIEDSFRERDDTLLGDLQLCPNGDAVGEMNAVNPLNPRYFVQCPKCYWATPKFQDENLARIAWNYREKYDPPSFIHGSDPQ